MKIVKNLGFVLLAVYLILVGIAGLANIGIPAILLNLLALVTGALILFWIGRCCCCEAGACCDKRDKIDKE